MAILGIQFVISFTAALFMQKLSPYYSLARWILCNKLYRYLYPSNDALKALAGRVVTKPVKGKRNIDSKKNVSNGGQVARNIETFTIPCNLEITLEQAKVEEVDLYTQHRYQDYRWLVDISLCAFVVYSCVEIAVLWKSEVRAQEFNLSLVWCLMIVCFAIKELASLTAAYWHGQDSGERAMCISFGLFFLVLSMGVLVIDESILEFGLENGYKSFMDNLISCMKELGFTTREPPPLWSFKLALAVMSALVGAFVGFPGLRLANMYLDSLYYHESQPLFQVLLHAAFIGPILPVLAWIRPLARENLVSLDANSQNSLSLTTENFPKARILIVLSVCLLRMAMTRTSLQSYLNMANERVKKLRKETGKITNVQLQSKVARIFFYMSTVALQYLAPVILIFFLSLSWLSVDAAGSTPASVALNATSNSTVFSEGTRYVAVLRRAFYCGELIKGLVSYFTWWTSLTWLSTSLFGVCYLRTFNS
ncbi:transmembrane protein 161B-like [Rhopilema esculentum]|uniref:transmembrane protein 161B-like n=1 Tax=Rhopilema esculentum TaxID=499914 RepID=UPI0031D43EE6